MVAFALPVIVTAFNTTAATTASAAAAAGSTAALVGTAAVTVGSQLLSARAQRKVAEQAEDVATGQAIRERRQLIRRERIRRAEIINSAFDQGTQGSSSQFAAVGSQTSQTAQNLGTSFATQNTSSRIAGGRQKALDFNTLSNIFASSNQVAQKFI